MSFPKAQQEGVQSLADDFLNDLEELEMESQGIVVENLTTIASKDSSELCDSEQLKSLVNLQLQATNLESLQEIKNWISLIEKDIVALSQRQKQLYHSKFPELADLVPQPVEYAQMVQMIGNQTSITNLPLNQIVSSNRVIPIVMSFQGAQKSILPDEIIEKLATLSSQIQTLNTYKNKLEQNITSVIKQIAPNLCKLVGSQVASKLFITAGGLKELIKMPACNLQVLGLDQTHLNGRSATGAGLHRGYLSQASILQDIPTWLEKKAIRILAAKCALAIRRDLFNPNNDNLGKSLKEQVKKRLEDSINPTNFQPPKPMDIPEEKQKPKRGGRRIRAAKQKYALTDIQKQRNRLQFTVDAPEEDLTNDFGMIGKSNVIRTQVKGNKIKLGKRSRQQMASSGLASMYAFNATQGISLPNPDASLQPTASRYFDSKSGFETVTNSKNQSQKMRELLAAAAGFALGALGYYLSDDGRGEKKNSGPPIPKEKLLKILESLRLELTPSFMLLANFATTLKNQTQGAIRDSDLKMILLEQSPIKVHIKKAEQKVYTAHSTTEKQVKAAYKLYKTDSQVNEAVQTMKGIMEDAYKGKAPTINYELPELLTAEKTIDVLRSMYTQVTRLYFAKFQDLKERGISIEGGDPRVQQEMEQLETEAEKVRSDIFASMGMNVGDTPPGLLIQQAVTKYSRESTEFVKQLAQVEGEHRRNISMVFQGTYDPQAEPQVAEIKEDVQKLLGV